MSSVLFNVLQKYVSLRDAATRARAENFYHAFLLALLAGAEGIVSNVISNGEAGDGYADIVFTSLEEDVGVVLELKHCGPQEKIQAAEAALQQIRDKHYVKRLSGFGCRRYFGFGLAFSGKSCAVTAAALDPAEV